MIELFEQNVEHDLFFDMLTVYDFYKQRTQCINKFPNYVGQKLLEYFDNVVNKLNTYDTLLHLHLYLVVNCMVLGVRTTEILGNEVIDIEDYPQYVGQIKDYNKVLYDMIIKRCNSLYN